MTGGENLRGNSWVSMWLCVIRAQPWGNWIIRGNAADRVGGAPDVLPFPMNDNGEQKTR